MIYCKSLPKKSKQKFPHITGNSVVQKRLASASGDLLFQKLDLKHGSVSNRRPYKSPVSFVKQQATRVQDRS